MRPTQQLVRAVQRLATPLPTTLLLALVRRFPKLAIGIPAGRSLRFDEYLGDLRVYVDTTYPMERKLLSGEYERYTMQAVERFVRPGHVCLDIGANVGPVTLLLAQRVGADGRVYAFEPGPPMFERLRRNLAANPALAERVQLLNLGLADMTGSLFWNEETHNPGNGELRQGKGTPVAIETIDSFVAANELKRLDFVKIDVEGMEERVIAGGTATWQALRPTLYFETLPAYRYRDGQDSFATIERMLAAIGYGLYAFDRGGALKPVACDRLPDNTIAIAR